MAQLLSSPGVMVDVTDETHALPTAPGTVPLLFIATAENKLNGAGTGIAPGTLRENAGQVFTLTSQKDVVDLFGVPTFKLDGNNNPIHGSEQNEYGLQAAYSYLGVSNRVYAVRANCDLNELTGSSTMPAGLPADGDWWFNPGATNFGIFEWNSNTQTFNLKYPEIIVDPILASGDNYSPAISYGAIGDYVMVTVTNLYKLWYKKAQTNTPAGIWVEVGSPEWISSHPVIKSSNSVNATDISTNVFKLNNVSIVDANTVQDLVDIINTGGTVGISPLVLTTSSTRRTFVDGVNPTILASVTVKNTSGVFECDMQALEQGQAVKVSGAVTGGSGSIAGYNGNTTYYYVKSASIIDNKTTFTLVTSYDYAYSETGGALTTVEGTITGLTFIVGDEPEINTKTLHFDSMPAIPNIGAMVTGPQIQQNTVVVGYTKLSNTNYRIILNNPVSATVNTETTLAFRGTINPLVPGVTASYINNRVSLYSTGVAITLNGDGWDTLYLKHPSDSAKTYYSPMLHYGTHTQVPQWKNNSTTSRPSGSIWIKTTTPNSGADWNIKQYDEAANSWVARIAPIYASNRAALYGMDIVYGGNRLTESNVYVKYNVTENSVARGDFKIFKRRTTGPTRVGSVAFSANTFNFTTLNDVRIAGFGGQFTCTNTLPLNLMAGQTVKVSGALSPSATGRITDYNAVGYYKISETDDYSMFTLVNLDGSPIATNIGTTDGLTFSAPLDKQIGFIIKETLKSSPEFSNTYVIPAYRIYGSAADADVLAGKINNLGMVNTRATVVSLTNNQKQVILTHGLGGDIVLQNTSNSSVLLHEIFTPQVTNNFYSDVIYPEISKTVTAQTSNTLTFESNADLHIGMLITGANIQPYTYIIGIGEATDVMATENAIIGDETRLNLLGLDNNQIKLSKPTLGTVFDVTFDDIKYTGTLWTSVNDSGEGIIPASNSAPSTVTANGAIWYNTDLGSVDILVHTGSAWVGYQYDGSGTVNTPSPFAGLTDPNGPIISAIEPRTQSNGNPLRTGDLWISTEDLENYPKIYRYDSDLYYRWFQIDTDDQTTENGIIFADARWTATGIQSLTYNGEPSTIQELLNSDYVDFDVPDPALYPQGMLLWNLRRSGFNVKRFVRNHVDRHTNNSRYPIGSYTEGQLQEEYYPHRWVSAAPNHENGTGSFGRKSQRSIVVNALKDVIDTNDIIRNDEVRVYNLIACPGYPEVNGSMVSLNYDYGLSAFVVGDSPARLAPDTKSLSDWGNNVAKVHEDSDMGLSVFDDYIGVYYPWGRTNDNYGNTIVVPPSHMILRTIALNDNVSYPWFAFSGVRRGGITNANSVGYIDSTGAFKQISLNKNQLATIASIKVNPITYIDGTGYVNFDNLTRTRNNTALSQVSVVRLVAFLRRQLGRIGKPYVFQPNDKITRDEFKGSVDSLMLELVGQRGVYDFVTVCDTSNNTPDRITRDELWLDCAIAPTRAVRFIYIPLRLRNPGAL